MKRKYIFVVLPFLFVFVFGLLFVPRAHAVSITVSTADDVLDKWDGFCSLREAIISANANTDSGPAVGECPGGSDTETDVIILADGEEYILIIPGVNEDTSYTGDLDILDNTAELDVQIVVADDGAATINADGIDRVIHVLTASVEFNNVSLTNGDAKLSAFDYGGNLLNQQGNVTINGGQIMGGIAESGGGINSYSNVPGTGKLVLNGTQVILNHSAMWGGGIGGGGGNSDIKLNGVIIRGNTSNSMGGGFAVEGGTLEVISSTVSLNVSAFDGGGMVVGVTSYFTATNTLFESNKATNGDGGGLFIDTDGSLSLHALTFSQNLAGQNGGAIYNVIDTYLPVYNSEFTSNYAGIQGGAIHADYPQVYDSYFENNTAPFGGAIFAGVGSYVYDSEFSGNSADLMGGAIHTIVSVNFRTQFIENSAVQFGGAIRTLDSLYVEESTFIQNHADLLGGGIYLEGAGGDYESIILGSTLARNTSSQDGGGLYVGPAIFLEVANSTLFENEATNLGGGVYIAASGVLTTTNVTFAANQAGGMLGSALYNAGITSVRNTLFGDHSFTTCETVNPIDLISLGHNLSESADCQLTALDDMPGTSAGLASFLQDNGGLTWTLALNSTSSAINSGNPIVCEGSLVNGVDQRGNPRFGICDIGAFEVVFQMFLPSIIK